MRQDYIIWTCGISAIATSRFENTDLRYSLDMCAIARLETTPTAISITNATYRIHLHAA